MFKKKMLPMLVFCLLVTVPGSQAFLELDAAVNEKTVYLGDLATFDLTVRNYMALDSTLQMQVSGDPQEWVSTFPEFVKVPGGGTSNFSVEFFPRGESVGTFTYSVQVTSHTPPSKLSTDSHDFTMHVIRPLDIEDFAASKSGDNLFLSMILNSKAPDQASLDFIIRDYKGQTIKEFSLTASVNGLTAVEETVQLPGDMLAGDYNVEAYLTGTPVKAESMFTVIPVHRVTEAVKKTSSTLYDDFEVTIVNEGNVREPQYITYKTLPNNDWITGLMTDPETCFIRNGEKTCRYVFSDLSPGDSVTLNYRLDYWSIYAFFGLILVAIFMLTFFGMRRATAPIIIKRHVRRSGGKHHVILEIRNPFFHNLSNAIVRDWVSPLANVIHHEIDMVKPLVRRSDAGTELIWKLGDIRPKETRIITYPLKALVQGSLKMPKAYIRYNKPNGRLRRIFSKPIIISA
jgi:hypothetical protein